MNAKEFGVYLKQLADDRGVTQGQISEYTGISKGEISKIFSGKRKTINPIILMKMAPYLGKDPMELFSKAYNLPETYETQETVIFLPKGILEGLPEDGVREVVSSAVEEAKRIAEVIKRFKS